MLALRNKRAILVYRLTTAVFFQRVFGIPETFYSQAPHSRGVEGFHLQLHGDMKRKSLFEG